MKSQFTSPHIQIILMLPVEISLYIKKMIGEKDPNLQSIQKLYILIEIKLNLIILLNQKPLTPDSEIKFSHHKSNCDLK